VATTTAKSPTGSQLVFEFQPTTPSGTAESSPYTKDLTLPQYEVQLIQWVVPPGPQGNLGWQLWYSGAIVVPQNGGWIITDNERNTWELDELPVAGDWQFHGYNTGDYDHTVYLRFLVNPLTQEETTTLEDLGLLQTISFPNAGEPVTGNVLVP
jgi:hypothetical protein